MMEIAQFIHPSPKSNENHNYWLSYIKHTMTGITNYIMIDPMMMKNTLTQSTPLPFPNRDYICLLIYSV